MSMIKTIIKRLKCKHKHLRLVEYGDVYSDLCGYEYTRFVFKCLGCGKRHISKTRSPEYFLKLLNK